jgi:hypothetical protein
MRMGLPIGIAIAACFSMYSLGVLGSRLRRVAKVRSTGGSSSRESDCKFPGHDKETVGPVPGCSTTQAEIVDVC